MQEVLAFRLLSWAANLAANRFGGLRVDAAVARELLRAVEPMAIEAAVEAERRYMEARGEQQRIVELELQQARYEASLAETALRCL